MFISVVCTTKPVLSVLRKTLNALCLVTKLLRNRKLIQSATSIYDESKY